MRGLWRFIVTNYLGFEEIVEAWAQSSQEAKEIIIKKSEYPVKDIRFLDGDIPLVQPLVINEEKRITRRSYLG